MTAITDRDRIAARVRELGPWFHNLDLHGVRTAPDHFLGDYPSVKWRRIAPAVPTDLAGASVLDVGCNAGFYALEMKRRGAGRVVGIDHDDAYLAQARFAAETLGFGDVEFRKLDVYHVGELRERFDLVIFMGVLYHLRHPLLALDLLHENAVRPGGTMLFQSMQRGSTEVAEVEADYDFFQMDHFDAPGYPKMHFIEHRYSHDETNWWAPNAACVEAMLRSSGFEVTAHPEQEVYLCRHVEVPWHPQWPFAAYPTRNPLAPGLPGEGSGG